MYFTNVLLLSWMPVLPWPNKKRRGFKLGQERCGARSGIGQHPWRPEIYYRTIAYLHPSLWSNLSFFLLPLTFKHCMCSSFLNSRFTHSLCYMWHHPTHHQIHLSPESPGYQELLELSCRALCQDLLRPLSQKLSQIIKCNSCSDVVKCLLAEFQPHINVVIWPCPAAGQVLVQWCRS